MKKFNIGSLFCHFYILILILSYFSHGLNTFIKFMILITGTFLVTYILLELKKLLNKKCSIKNLNFFIYSFIFLEFFSVFQFLLPLITTKNTPNFSIYILVVSVILQFLFASLILKANFKKIKFLTVYGYSLFVSGFFSLFFPASFINIFLPIAVTFILGEIFFEGANLV
ncbi:MAG: hypothetical protein RR191_02825 [Cetobacterium sp.]|uniref:hypothetical protein n=1 Tax=unclassified Cetobacterium TaxID=2630983 RepID=UPI00163B9082|nr:hypothetical protein [Cetobacterium sp. 2A]MBC2856732.1 hypothetical protein [Cetobacterium sp. 2A]